MPIKVEFPDGVKAKDYLAKLNSAINEGMPSLFRSLGDIYVADVKHRIISQDDGKWAPASKWLKAKSGQSVVLDGTEKYVKARVTKNALSIYGSQRGWSFTQHHEGFENALVGPGEERDAHGRVVLQIKDPRPLNLYVEYRKKRDGSSIPRATVFAFVAKRAGRTPARKIWATAEEAIRLGQPTASRWLAKIVKDTGGSLVHV